MKTKTPQAQINASQRFRDRMYKEGCRPCNLWVPIENIDEVKEYVKKLREVRT